MNLESLITEHRNDPHLAGLSSEAAIQAIQKIAHSRGLIVSVDQIRSELDRLSEESLDSVAGGGGEYWGKKWPNHSQGGSA